MPSKSAAVTPASSSRPTPISSPRPLPDTELVPKLTVGMSKEEKASEMARRKEERRLVRKFLRADSPSNIRVTMVIVARRKTERTEKERDVCGQIVS